MPHKFAHIGQTTRNSSRSRHGGRYQVRARARPLPSHEIAVRCRCAALTARHLVGIHAKTGRTAGLTPFESGFGKDAIKPLLLRLPLDKAGRSEEHTSELQSLMRISYAVFCLK